MVDARKLADRLSEEFGLEIQAEIQQEKKGTVVSFRPVGMARAHGFAVRVILGWRSVEAEFVPDSFAKEIVHAMEKSWHDRRWLFESFVRATVASGIQLSVLIGGHKVDPSGQLAGPWPSMEIRAKKTPIVLEPGDQSAATQVVALLASRVFGLALSLLTDDKAEAIEEPEGLPEGALSRIEVNRYERNPLNRAACIQFQGAVCKVCGFDFAKIYGSIGVGFINVHHVTSIADIGPNYIINPMIDLVPLCPNCHAMAHRRKPAYTVDELKGIIRETGGKPPPTI